MTKIAIVGCTGKLGSTIMNKILNRKDVSLQYAIARKGNPTVGQDISIVLGGKERNIMLSYRQILHLQRIKSIFAVSAVEIFLESMRLSSLTVMMK